MRTNNNKKENLYKKINYYQLKKKKFNYLHLKNKNKNFFYLKEIKLII